MDTVTGNPEAPGNPVDATPAAPVADGTTQVLNVPTPPVSPAPAVTAEPKAPKQHPDLTSRQTAGAIAYYSQPENREVFDHLVGQVNKAYGNSGLDAGQYVPRKQYEIDKAVARYGLDDASAELLSRVEVGAIQELAARLAPAPSSDNTVKPNEPAAPTEAAKLPRPTAAASGKKPPAQIVNGDDLAAAFQAFKGGF